MIRVVVTARRSQYRRPDTFGDVRKVLSTFFAVATMLTGEFGYIIPGVVTGTEMVGMAGAAARAPMSRIACIYLPLVRLSTTTLPAFSTTFVLSIW